MSKWLQKFPWSKKPKPPIAMLYANPCVPDDDSAPPTVRNDSDDPMDSPTDERDEWGLPKTGTIYDSPNVDSDSDHTIRLDQLDNGDHTIRLDDLEEEELVDPPAAMPLPVCKVVGRHEKCDVRLTDPTVSNVHCEIRRTEQQTYLIRDLGSTNGTYINGTRIDITWSPLQTGDILKLGAYECSFEEKHPSLPVLKLD